MSRTTVADLRRLFGTLFGVDEFIPLLNQSLQGILQDGRWASTQVHATFPSSPLGYLTLPYEFVSIMGITLADAPVPIFGNYHEFLISGPGHIDETKPATGIIDFINDLFPARFDIPTDGSTLRIVLDSSSDVGKIFRFYGDSGDKQIFDVTGAMGFNVTTTGTTTNSAQLIDSLTGIQVPVDPTTGESSLVGGWSLYSVNAAVATLLSYYYPNESRPSYARYKTGTWNIDEDPLRPIRVLCQRRFIPVFKETDWVVPGNARALKSAMQAVQNEDANNYKEGDPNWIRTFGLLNNEVHNARGGARPEITIPQTMFGGYTYDGGLWGGWNGCS